MKIISLNSFAPQKISFKNQERRYVKSYASPIQDTFKISNTQQLYERNLQKICKKLTDGVVSKKDLDNLLLQYNEEDREIVKDILVLSAPNLTFNGVFHSLYKIFSESETHSNFIKIDSNFSDFISYMHRRHAHGGSSSYPKTKKIDINELDKIHDFGESFYITEGIFNRDLTDREFKLLASIKNLKIVNLNFYEQMPNFIDFAISNAKAKSKIDILLEKIKKLKKENNNLSNKEAIEQINSEYLQKNLERYRTFRLEEIKSKEEKHKEFIEQEKNLYKNLAPNLSFAEKIAYELKLNQPLNIPIEPEILSISSDCDNYDEIENYLNILPRPRYKKYDLSQHEPVDCLLKNNSETLMRKFTTKVPSAKNTAQLLASDEFTYYSPKKFVDALKDIIAQLEKDLSKKNKKIKDCIFWYNDSKSEALIGYLLEEMGIISQKQRAKIGKEKPSMFKINVFIDDILGSGFTANDMVKKMKYNPYCLNVVSCSVGRNLAGEDANFIYHQDSFNAHFSKFNEARKFSCWDVAPVVDCNSSEIFFFSFPDNCHRDYRWFARDILGLKTREDEDWS